MQYDRKEISDAFLAGLLKTHKVGHVVESSQFPYKLKNWVEEGQPTVWSYVNSYRLNGHTVSVFYSYLDGTCAILIHESGVVMTFVKQIDWGTHTFERTADNSCPVRVTTVEKPLAPPI